MQYAYIRVSSTDQNTARQEEALLKVGFQPDKFMLNMPVLRIQTDRSCRSSLSNCAREIRFLSIPSIAFVGI